MAAALCAARCAQRGLRDVTAECAGLTAREGEPLPPPVLQALNEAGLTPLHTGSRRLTPKMAVGAELVITMSPAHRDRVVERLPWIRLKVVPLLGFIGDREGEVPDPFGGGLEAYRACLRGMRPAIEALLDELTQG